VSTVGKHVAITIPSTQAHEVNTWPSLSYFAAAVRKDVAITIPSTQAHEGNTWRP